MSPLQVKKVVVVAFLEATKANLEQMGARRLELSEHGVATPPELTRAYNEVRRLRDYLQRCVAGYADQVDLDIAPPDLALLVACLRRFVGMIDVRMAADRITAEDKEALHRKQQTLMHWALELVEKPLVELPTLRQTGPAGDGERTLRSMIQDKLYGDVRQRPKILPPQSGSVVLNGQRSFGDVVKDADAKVEPELAAAAVAAGGTAAPAPAPVPAPVAESSGQGTPGAAMLFDHRKVGDPRLRALAGVDLRSYARALGAADYRLATVLLASVLESALLDHVAPRRVDFGVAGSPETWNVPELLVKALGDGVSPKDRTLAAHLFAARNLLRPAVQMMAPTVVTIASFDTLRDFVQRALHGLGYGAATVVASDEDALPQVEPPPRTGSLEAYAAMVDPEE
jgi:hypothetical protein